MKIKDYLQNSFKKNYSFRVLHYDITYEIDATNEIFHSSQNISFQFSGAKNIKTIEGLLERRLVVDSLELFEKNSGEKLPIKWEIKQFEDTYIRKEGFEGISGQLIVITLKEDLNTGQEFLLKVKFTMPKEDIGRSKPLYIGSLCIHEDISYSVEPFSGHYFRLVPGSISAPFDIQIKYPKDQYACIPGVLVSQKKEGNYLIEHYQSKTRNVPVFAVSKYSKIVREKDGFGVEFYLYPHQSISDELINPLFEVVQLYVKTFGDNGTRLYKYATVGMKDSSVSGGENKGNAIFYDESFFTHKATDPEKYIDFLATNAHEIYHNWNLFYSSVSGILGEWFGEGGANFIAAWAIEKVVGITEGAKCRYSYVRDYIEREGFNAKDTLANASKLSGKESVALMYSFGALVWEQLRQKIGLDPILLGLKKFYQKYPLGYRTYNDFIACVQEETSVDVMAYLDQWINYHTKIELSIIDVDFSKLTKSNLAEIKIQVDADRDYELFTELGYKFDEKADFEIIPVHLDKKGIHTITFECKDEPMLIQLDPMYRIPQVSIEKGVWKK